MKGWLRFFILGGLVLLMASLVAAAQEPVSYNLEGVWIGKVTVPGGQVKIIMTITKNDDGLFTGKYDRPDKEIAGALISKITMKGRNVHLEMSSVSASFEGVFSKKGDKISGDLIETSYTVPMTLERQDLAQETPKSQDLK